MHVKFDVVRLFIDLYSIPFSLNIGWQMHVFSMISRCFFDIVWLFFDAYSIAIQFDDVFWYFSMGYRRLFDCIIYLNSYSIPIKNFYRLSFLLHFLIIFAIFCYGCQSCSVVLITLVEEFEGTWDSFRSWWETCQVWNWQDWTSDHFLKMCLIALGLFPHT